MKKIVLASCAVVLFAISVSTALAAPINAPNSTVFTLQCGEAGTFTVVTNGNGSFTPAHDLNSNAVLIPVSFGATTITLKNGAGGVVIAFTEDPTAKGSAAPKGHPAVGCTFVSTGPFSDPEFPTATSLTVSGSVIGFIA